ncbi:SPOR domain-containing protein [Pseudooceanicola sp. C21-150M6]|uniref:SPOR domain-containing protein n=1 Tax=Pseudooceanicola sp. C21-150M6 TaxID=3434355 RepID=UPI003D7FC104
MSRFTRNVTTYFLLAALAAGGAAAQSRKDGPAEYPPASFSGKQYVDSRGCVYIRAGVNGATQWIPRMTRARQVVCGFQPTQVAGTTSTPQQTAGRVTVITAADPEPQSVAKPAPAPVAAPARVAQAAPKRKPVPANLKPARSAAPVTTSPVVIRPASAVTGPATQPVRPYAAAPVITAPVQPVREARPVVVAPSRAPVAATRVTGGCPGMSAMAQRYMTGAGLRCGPQDVDYATGAPRVMARTTVAGTAPVSPAPTFAAPLAPSYDGSVPRRVVAVAPAPVRSTGPKVFTPPAQTRQAAVSVRRVDPATIHPDARIMPRAAYENRVQTAGVITVPKGYRRVWEDDRLNPHRAEGTLRGKQQMEMVWTKTLPRRLVPVTLVDQTAGVAPAPAPVVRSTVSSRNVAPAPKPARGEASYVQVGTFSPESAQKVAQQMAARGLPVRIRDTGMAHVVLTGPFGSAKDVGLALRTAQSAGYRGAFPRR